MIPVGYIVFFFYRSILKSMFGRKIIYNLLELNTKDFSKFTISFTDKTRRNFLFDGK
jgi:hypothetical protein